MNKLFLHEAYKDKTDEELIALRKSHFKFTKESTISVGEAQQYHDFLCLPPGTEWEDNEDTKLLTEKIDAYCKRMQYWDYDHLPDSPRWSAVYGLIEIINDYPEITTNNIDFVYFLDGWHFDDDVLDIIQGIHDDAKRIEFASYFLRYFNLFIYKDCFLNEKRKPDTSYIKQFKDQLRCKIDQTKDKIKMRTPLNSSKTTCAIEYSITVKDLANYAYSEEGKDIRERLNPMLRYFATEKGWEWGKINQQIEKAKKTFGEDITININIPKVDTFCCGNNINQKN